MININKDFYKKLDYDKIKINWNKNPIKMDLFLSFLLVDVTKSKDHLGCSTGWTLYENNEKALYISGGIVQRIEYLDSIQYGKKLQNIYNDYINPFYLFEIFNNEGKQFFINYYKKDILSLVERQKNKLKELQNKIEIEKGIYIDYIDEFRILEDKLNEGK